MRARDLSFDCVEVVDDQRVFHWRNRGHGLLFIRCENQFWLGAFNQWVRGSVLEDWRQRHVDVIANHLMEGCADYLAQRLRHFSSFTGEQV